MNKMMLFFQFCTFFIHFLILMDTSDFNFMSFFLYTGSLYKVHQFLWRQRPIQKEQTFQE